MMKTPGVVKCDEVESARPESAVYNNEEIDKMEAAIRTSSLSLQCSHCQKDILVVVVVVVGEG